MIQLLIFITILAFLTPFVWVLGRRLGEVLGNWMATWIEDHLY